MAVRFNWPPDVTRRQSVRDLLMIADVLAAQNAMRRR